MAKTCPIQSSGSWKRLIEQVSPGDRANDLAWATWEYYDGYPSTLKSTSALKREISIPNKASSAQLPKIGTRVRRYNSRHNTSHSYDLTQVGESDNWDVDFKVNYLPVNIEKQRQRDFQRTGKDSARYDFSNPATQGLPKINERNLSEEEQEIIKIHRGRGTYLQDLQGNSTKLTANNWVIAQTKGFREYYGEYIVEPTNNEVVDYLASELIVDDNPIFDEIDTGEAIKSEDTPIRKTGHEAQQITNLKEASKEGMLAGDFVSMTEQEFDHLFPNYDWMDLSKKEAVVQHIMNGNIKLTCGL